MIQGVRMRRSGFTLVEMLIVIIIILLLMALLGLFVASVKEKAQYARCRAFIDTLNSACSNYKVDFGNYPLDDKGDLSLHYYLGIERRIITQHVESGPSPTAKRPPLVDFSLEQLKYSGSGPVDPATQAYPLQDPWEYTIRYKGPGNAQWNKTSVDIWSPGMNGIDELDPNHPDFDDVTNWQKDF